MRKKRYNCPGELTLDLIGGKWNVIVLWLLRKGPQRSGKLRSQMPGISPAAFSASVRFLESAGLIERKVRPVYPPEVSYRLSERGGSLGPIVKSLVKWGLMHRNEYLLGSFGMDNGEATTRPMSRS